MTVSERSSGFVEETLTDLTEGQENHSPMRPPFLGMDPWLEHPAIWPDVHNRLIAAIADELTPRVAPRYYLGLEQRIYELQLGELVADVAYEPDEVEESTAVGVHDVEV